MALKESDNGIQKAIQPKPEVEFFRRSADLTQRPWFANRVYIHYRAYLLPFRIYRYHYTIVTATGVSRFFIDRTHAKSSIGKFKTP